MSGKIMQVNANQESVWDYPLRPRVEGFTEQLKIVFNGVTIANSFHAKRVLERGHPPVYYVPFEDIEIYTLISSSRKTWCEWKGEAHYFDLKVEGKIAKDSAWHYPNPRRGFEGIKGHVAFYAGKMDACYVGDELVIPQEGDFYGGWITSDIIGPYKGARRQLV